MVSPGTRSAYFGFPGTSRIQLVNEVANGGILLQGNGSGTLSLVTGTSGDISMVTGSAGNILLNAGGTGVTVFYTGGAERGRASTTFMWGKSTPGIANVGCELFESGVIYATNATAGQPNMVMRRNGSASATDQPYVQFMKADGNIVAAILQDAASPEGVHFVNCKADAPVSDYRLKNDLGPLTGALDRVLTLQPKHLSWKESGTEFDGFLAHEVAEVAPYAVTGEKDAVFSAEEAEVWGRTPGDIKAQRLDAATLVPLLVAAVQELADRMPGPQEAA